MIVIWACAGVAAALYFAAFLGIAAYEDVSWRRDSRNADFEQMCGRCHSAKIPRRYAMAPSEWRKTVDLMMKRNAGDANYRSPARRQRLVNLLVDKRSADGRTLFLWRCGRCHARAALNPYLILDERTLRALLQQHVAQNNFAIQKWEGDMIVDYVASQRAAGPPADIAAAQRQYDFQAFCGLCHNVSFLYRRMCAPPKSDGEWETLVARMRDKAPDAAGADRTAAMAERSREICATKGQSF